MRTSSTGSRIFTYLFLVVLLLLVVFPVYYGSSAASWGPRTATRSRRPSSRSAGCTRRTSATSCRSSRWAAVRQLRAPTAAITIGQVVTSALAAYAFVFLPLRKRGLWFGLFLSTMMIPFEAIIIPNYLTVSTWGLKNTVAGLALPFLASGFGTFLLRQSFLGFPTELRDAARVDGAGHLRFLWSILLPLSRPTLAALGIYSALSAWNMYFWPLLVTEAPSDQTIQIGIGQLQTSDGQDPGLVLAGVVLALIPTLLLVVFGQRFIVRGLTAGAVK